MQNQKKKTGKCLHVDLWEQVVIEWNIVLGLRALSDRYLFIW